jgi:hypothetical protein
MRKKLATTIVMVSLLLMAALPATAAAATPRQSDLSSLAAIQAYLSSIGVDPSAVVVQQGQFNYAGPSCPGAGWNCTTASMVVQISTSNSGANLFDCQPTLNVSLLGISECLVVQSSASDPLETASTLNSASCSADLGDGSGRSKCTVKQSSKKGNNRAVIRQNINQNGGSPQSATEEAEIDQTSETGNNTATISQTIQQTLKMDPPTDVTQEQQARQLATVNQMASGAGSNSSSVTQSQSQDESASGNASITQRENVGSTNKNQEASITQQSATGNNDSTSSQTINQHQAASSNPGPVSQTEGTAGTGGQKKTVTQTTNAPGVNSSTPTQSENQKQEATTSGTLTQTKIGPQDCCSTQFGGTSANVNVVTQSNVQTDNNVLGSSQTSEQNGHCVAAAGDNCTVDQTYTANGSTNHMSTTGPTVTSDRLCSGSVEGSFCSGGE